MKSKAFPLCPGPAHVSKSQVRRRDSVARGSSQRFLYKFVEIHDDWTSNFFPCPLRTVANLLTRTALIWVGFWAHDANSDTGASTLNGLKHGIINSLTFWWNRFGTWSQGPPMETFTPTLSLQGHFLEQTAHTIVLCLLVARPGKTYRAGDWPVKRSTRSGAWQIDMDGPHDVEFCAPKSLVVLEGQGLQAPGDTKGPSWFQFQPAMRLRLKSNPI